MTSAVGTPPQSLRDPDAPAADQSLPSQLRTLFRALRAAPDRVAIGCLLIGIMAVIIATAFGQVRLNAWNQPFYDALAQKNLSAFGYQLLVFAILASSLLALNIAQSWLHQMIQLRLRQWLTGDLMNEWLKPGRGFRLVWAGEIGRNPDQRIHEDARHLTELSADLVIGLFQAALLLGSFVGVLWVLSRDVVFSFQGSTFTIPGYMVWAALFYAGTVSWLSWRIGRPLIALNDERYGREADFRYMLVRVSEHADGIALRGGEADERERLDRGFDRVLTIMRQLISAGVRLTWVTAGYGWFAIVAPILVAAPGYFGGGLSFGGLMMVVGAFYQVQQSLRWFVDNFSRIADWRATLSRVTTFRQTLLSVERPPEGVGRIAIEDHPAGGLAFENLVVVSAYGRSALDPGLIEIAPGEHVLIIGKPGSGKSTLFRAINGVWPWGSGRILLPPRTSMMFLPQRPYMPLGSLREILTYPLEPSSLDDAVLTGALQRTGLGHLASSLDSTRRWDRELAIDEQQRVAFTRLLLHKPQWVFIDEAIDMLDEDHRQIILSIFEQELKETAVVSIGRRASRNGFYTRVLHLTRCKAEQMPVAVQAAGGQPSLLQSGAAG